MPKKKTSQPNIVSRPPIVVIMGHIDHGKSTLLDYVRKTNIVDGEAGGITQHLSAYCVEHTSKDGVTKNITFLDTPGHEAFQKMRFRGADIADIAILIVSAEDGVKPQTLEALTCIKKANIPYIVAINKIDKPGADLIRTQSSLIENEIYIEGMGGDISWAPISAKSGQGVDDLLDILLLTAELAELKADASAPGVGTVIEGHLDGKRGNTATLMITDGTVTAGTFVVSGTSYAPVRIMEDWAGKNIKEASASEPVGIIGWNIVPRIGDTFITVANKKEAEAITQAGTTISTKEAEVESDIPCIPLLIKADVLGTIDAIIHELEKYKSDRLTVRIIGTGVGSINSNDVQNVSATKNAIIVGFNVKPDRATTDLAERLGVEIETFDIIYKLSEWLEVALKNRTPHKEEERITGKAKILKHFSTQKNAHVLGGRIEEGTLSLSQHVRITRRDVELGRGVLKNIQQQKSNVQKVSDGEFGMQLDSKIEVAPGDYIEAFDIVVI
ncbi:MAG: translation initiation factor IF-2 [Candidatus Pacebacteria bacterium]|nr:translation initiation factor IF-2 [Candidatus Paceibacterota bacterium]MCF7857286.1 translation initiation factor IF-2 [Candidatus Paceibacterota bacterium]